jgi:L-Ala-D/L-Glu epimerase
MALITTKILQLEKRFPLTIARGTLTHSDVLWLRWSEDGVDGWGEAVAFNVGDYRNTIEDVADGLAARMDWLSAASAWQRFAIERRLREETAPSALIAAISQALLDWTGKRAGLPVPRLLGLTGAGQGPVTSVTIGISSPEAARERVRQWRTVGDVRAFKIKLGAPAGIAADQAMFDAVRTEAGAAVRLSVDANGGWNVEDACRMSAWLAERGIDYLEQPLARGREAELPTVRAASRLPVFVDESCFTSADVAALAGRVDGVNIKLMKCGGLDEAFRIVATARAHGLQLMVGCYSNTALGNTAAATLGPLVDHLDLDSHLNLKDDPFKGAAFRDGRLELPISPGFGISHD